MNRHRALVLAGLAVAALATAVTFTLGRDMRVEKIISAAEDQLGKPYVFGATGEASFDCSGLVQYCYASANVTLPRTAQEIGYDERFSRIDAIDDLRRGDIVCFNTVRDRDLSDHVGIYLGENLVLHASSGQRKVVVSEMEGYFAENFSWGVRPLD